MSGSGDMTVPPEPPGGMYNQHKSFNDPSVYFYQFLVVHMYACANTMLIIQVAQYFSLPLVEHLCV